VKLLTPDFRGAVFFLTSFKGKVGSMQTDLIDKVRAQNPCSTSRRRKRMRRAIAMIAMATALIAPAHAEAPAARDTWL
jgi:hypothetical protein